MLLMAIIPEVEITKPLLEVLVGNAGISVLALLVTAIVQTVKKQLSLYHAIFIIHMLYFTGIIVMPSGKQSRDYPVSLVLTMVDSKVNTKATKPTSPLGY